MTLDCEYDTAPEPIDYDECAWLWMVGHVSPRRWMKYVARNPAAKKTLEAAAKRAAKYLHASRRQHEHRA